MAAQTEIFLIYLKMDFEEFFPARSFKSDDILPKYFTSLNEGIVMDNFEHFLRLEVSHADNDHYYNAIEKFKKGPKVINLLLQR